MSEDLEQILNAHLLESLSPRTYADIVYNIKHGIKPHEAWYLEDILRSFDAPALGHEEEVTMYEQIVETVKARLRFERKIEQMRAIGRGSRRI